MNVISFLSSFPVDEIKHPYKSNVGEELCDSQPSFQSVTVGTSRWQLITPYPVWTGNIGSA